MAIFLDDPWVLSVDSRCREKYTLSGPFKWTRQHCADLNGDVVVDKMTWRREVDSIETRGRAEMMQGTGGEEEENMKKMKQNMMKTRDEEKEDEG